MITQSMGHPARFGHLLHVQRATRVSLPGVGLSRSTSRSLTRHLEPRRFGRRIAPVSTAAQTDRVNGAASKDSTVLPLDFYSILQVGTAQRRCHLRRLNLLERQADICVCDPIVCNSCHSQDTGSLLQVNPAASRDTLSKAFSRLYKQQPTAGYSTVTLEARNMLLKTALDELSNSGSRHAYDRRTLANRPKVGVSAASPRLTERS